MTIANMFNLLLSGCMSPVEKGPCMANIQNYFYNTQSGRCEKFTYSGCGGNENRFMSEDDCIKSCACHVKPDAGTCKGLMERWYYNPERGCCEKFFYGGCQGNSNNFNSYQECTKTCAGSYDIKLPKGLNWGSLKITSISGDRSLGGTFGKTFGGSRTVWLHNENAPMLGKGVLNAMSKPGMNLLGGSTQIVGREITGPGLIKSEKTSSSWSSGPIMTGGSRISMSSGPVVSGMSSMSSSSGMTGGGRGGEAGMSGNGGMVSGRGGMMSGGGGMMTGGSGMMGSGRSGGFGGRTGGGGVLSGGFGMGNSGKVDPGGFKISSGGGIVSDMPKSGAMSGGKRGSMSNMSGGKIRSQIQPPWMGRIVA